MGFSQLVQETKKVDVLGVNVTLKKLPYGFTSYYVQRMSEIKDLKVKEKYKEENVLLSEYLMSGIKAWDLKNEKGYVVPVDETVLLDLLSDYHEFNNQLGEEIMNFNTLPTELKKR